MSERTMKCLYVDDDREWLERLKKKLKPYAVDVVCEEDPDKTLVRLKEDEEFSVVLLDILFGSENKGKPVLENIKKIYPDLPVIMVTNTMLEMQYQNEDYSLAAYKYFKDALKSGEEQNYEQLASIIKKVVNEVKIQLVDEDFGFHIGKTEALQAACRRVLEIASLPSPVLIIGETGAGKELLARAIHKHSGRPIDRFFSSNMSEVPPKEGGLAQQDFLFGHVPGFFQHVRNDPGKAGIFEECNGGTVFLDEITLTLPEVQAQLLRVLQEDTVKRLGSTREIPVKFRLITATNELIDSLVAAGSFREDLYFRINTHQISLPPLRDRKQDIPSLYVWFVNELNPIQGKRILPQIRSDTMELLANYDWPGNMRELKNKIADAMSRSKSNILMPDDFELEVTNPESSRSIDLVNVWVENVWSGQKDWEDVKQEFGRGSEYRRNIIQELIDRLEQEKDATGAIGVRLAKKLKISRTNLSQILHELDPPILLREKKKRSIE